MHPAELPRSPLFDLPYAPARDPESPADLFQRHGLVAIDADPGAWDFGWAISDLGYRIWDSGFRIWHFGFGIFEFCLLTPASCLLAPDPCLLPPVS